MKDLIQESFTPAYTKTNLSRAVDVWEELTVYRSPTPALKPHRHAAVCSGYCSTAPEVGLATAVLEGGYKLPSNWHFITALNYSK